MTNEYTEKYWKFINHAIDEGLSAKEFKKRIEGIIDRVYEDGFSDGHDEGLSDAKDPKWS